MQNAFAMLRLMHSRVHVSTSETLWARLPDAVDSTVIVPSCSGVYARRSLKSRVCSARHRYRYAVLSSPKSHHCVLKMIRFWTAMVSPTRLKVYTLKGHKQHPKHCIRTDWS